MTPLGWLGRKTSAQTNNLNEALNRRKLFSEVEIDSKTYLDLLLHEHFSEAVFFVFFIPSATYPVTTNEQTKAWDGKYLNLKIHLHFHHENMPI